MRRSAAARLAEYASAAERDRTPAPWLRDGHYWSTSKSAALLAAVVIVAVVLAGLLTLVVELR